MMIGTTFSHFKILDKLGEGGMGVVYKADDQTHNRIVALKVLNRDAALDADVQRRFLREAGAGAGLVHPNIVQMYEAGSEAGQHFISLEFVDGKNLRDLLENGPFPPGRAVEIGMAVGDALQLAHNNGVIHRDIKAENIMITGDGVVKVMDFGLAKVQNASMLTREGDIVGTVAYMSPEQATGEVVDHRTDIFSFGVLLYELLSGKLPFWAAYETAIVYSILNTEPMSLREVKEDIPEALDQIVFRALRKDRQSRYQKIEDMTNDLSRVKAFFDGEREVLPSAMELVAGGEVAKDDIWGSQIKLAVRSGFQAGLAGREKEFGLLKERLQNAVGGKEGVVFLSGEAGIGKTRLVEELESFGKSLRVRMLACRCTTILQGAYPYQPFIEAFRDYFDNKSIKTAEAFALFIKQMAPGLEGRIPVLDVFLGLGEQTESALGSKEQLWDAVAALIRAIADERPLVLFIDDLHWADPDSLDLLAYLARNSPGAKLLLLGTYRSEEVRRAEEGPAHPLLILESELGTEGRLLAMRLGRLDAAAVREMSGSLFPATDFGSAFYESLFNETEGNPFFVVETLKLLKVEGAIEKIDGQFRLKENYDLVAIPRSIHDIVMRRIDRLKEDEREILEIGAVEGESFHSGTIGSCLELGRIRLLKKLQTLERDHHIIHPEETTYRFDHGKIREFLYDAITPELRIEYHRMIGDYLAETFPAEEHISANIAYHFVSGGNDEKALPFLVAAGERARRLFANGQALECYDRALGIAGKLASVPGKNVTREREIAMEGIADVFALTGKHREALAKYRDLAALPGVAPMKKTELLRKIGAVYGNIGENDKALESLTEAETSLAGQADQRAADQERKKALGKTRITRSRVFKSLGRYDQARREVEEGLALLKEDGSPAELADAYNNFGVIYEDLGDAPAAAEMYTKALNAREQIGDKKGMAVAYNNLANLFADQGDYRRTAENLKRSLDLMTEIGYRAGIAGACNNLGSVYQDQGRYDEARQMHERCLVLREEIGDAPGVAMSRCNLGSVALDLGNAEAALEHLKAGIALNEKLKIRSYESQTYSWLATALVRLGRTDEALAAAAKAEAIAVEMKQKHYVASAKRAVGVAEMARVAGGADPGGNAGKNLNESLALFEELKMKHEAGRSRLELARYFQATGKLDQCREYLLRAKEIFQQLGALGDLAAANRIQLK